VNELRERLAATLFYGHEAIEEGEDYALADAVLAALGLDDLDAAVERCAQGIVRQEIEDYGWDHERNRPTYPGGLGDLIRERTNLWRDNARRGLKAALISPPEKL
jgi:hypothetical protein